MNSICISSEGPESSLGTKAGIHLLKLSPFDPHEYVGPCPLRVTGKERILKSKTVFLALLFLIANICATCSTKNLKTVDTISENGSVIPVNGRVPNEETAIRIAEAVWLPIYGNDIYNSKPFQARLIGDSIWVVEGTLPEGHLGGVPYAALQKKDGKVLKISHGQ